MFASASAGTWCAPERCASATRPGTSAYSSAPTLSGRLGRVVDAAEPVAGGEAAGRRHAAGVEADRDQVAVVQPREIVAVDRGDLALAGGSGANFGASPRRTGLATAAVIFFSEAAAAVGSFGSSSSAPLARRAARDVEAELARQQRQQVPGHGQAGHRLEAGDALRDLRVGRGRVGDRLRQRVAEAGRTRVQERVGRARGRAAASSLDPTPLRALVFAWSSRVDMRSRKPLSSAPAENAIARSASSCDSAWSTWAGGRPLRARTGGRLEGRARQLCELRAVGVADQHVVVRAACRVPRCTAGCR